MLRALMNREDEVLRKATLSIIVLCVLLWALSGRWLSPAVGERTAAVPTPSVAAPAGANALTPAFDESADCRNASGMQDHLRTMMAQGIAYLQQAQDAVMGDLERWPEQIAASDDPRMRYIASFGPLGQRTGAIAPAERIRLVRDALAVDGTNPLYLSTLMRLCIEHRTQGVCDLPELERQLADYDGDNGLSWRLIGMSCTARGDTACAVEAIERAALAPAQRDHYVDTVLLAEQAMAAAGLSFPVSSSSAFAIAWMDQPAAVSKQDPCRGPPAPRMDRACLRHGVRLEAEGTASWTQLSGRVMQATAAERLGDAQAKAAAMLRLAQANDVLGVAIEEDGQLSTTQTVFNARLTWDRDFFLAFMAHMQQVGEARAFVDGATGWGTGPAECLRRVDQYVGE